MVLKAQWLRPSQNFYYTQGTKTQQQNCVTKKSKVEWLLQVQREFWQENYTAEGAIALHKRSNWVTFIPYSISIAVAAKYSKLSLYTSIVVLTRWNMRTEKKPKTLQDQKSSLSTAAYKNSAVILIGIGKASKRKSSWSLSVQEKR